MSQIVFNVGNNDHILSCTVQNMSLCVHKSSLRGGLPPLVTHKTSRYGVLYQTPIGGLFSNVACHISRFSVLFAPRRGTAFSGATFGRKRTRDLDAQHHSPTCIAHSAEPSDGVRAFLVMAKPSRRLK